VLHRAGADRENHADHGGDGAKVSAARPASVRRLTMARCSQFWGQQWLTLDLVPRANRKGRPFLQIDNGFVQPARGTLIGYYRISYRSLSPVLLNDAPPSRIKVEMAPWRTATASGHVILALPGNGFGRAIGLDMGLWIHRSQKMLRRATLRRIIIRPKKMRPYH